MYDYSSISRGPSHASQPRTVAGPWNRAIGMPTAVAILETAVHEEFALATRDAFQSLYVDSPEAAIQAVRTVCARALLVSPEVLDADGRKSLRTLIAKSPGVESIAVISRQASATDALVQLGAYGVRHVIDLRVPADYARLRTLVTSFDHAATGPIIDAVMGELQDAGKPLRDFFAAFVRAAPEISTTREIARTWGVSPSTFTSRFHRAELPSPKEYLARIRLAHAAAYLQAPRASIADVAYRLHYSSPQSFGRHIRLTLGLKAGEFRRQVTLDGAIEGLIGELFRPYHSILSTFDPIG